MDEASSNDSRLPGEVRRAAQLTLQRKADDVVVLDLRGISSATDYFLLATGRSDTQVRAISDHVTRELREEGFRPAHTEGARGARWVLIDYIDFVVHVFHPEMRSFYQLETLWGDAPRHEFAADTELAPP
jgi:ribosome-associated protein